MKALFILNGAPYGDERCYNGLRLANALAKRNGNEVRVFLLGDAVVAAKDGQKVPDGFYNLQIMLGKVARSGADRISACGTCMDARGIKGEELMERVHRGTLDELAEWSEWAEQTFVF